MKSENSLRAAVIGLGNIGFLFDLDPLRKETWSHVTAYKLSSNVALSAVVEIDAEKSSIFRKFNGGIPIYKSIADLMHYCKPDIVSICTPTSTHHDILMEVIKYPVMGIFCEKPLSFDIQESAEMVKACDRKKIILAVNFTRRWDDHFIYVKDAIQSGEIGKIRAINVNYPGQIFNIGSHVLDAINMLVGMTPQRVSGISSNLKKDDPDISGWIQFENGLICTINSIGKREKLVLEFDLLGDNGRIKILENGEIIEKFAFIDSVRYTGYWELKEVPFEKIKKNDRFVEAVNDIVSVIKNEKIRVNCTGYDGQLSMRIIRAMIDSAILNGLPKKI